MLLWTQLKIAAYHYNRVFEDFNGFNQGLAVVLTRFNQSLN